MRTITVGFSTRKKGLFSKLIRKLEGTPFSHSYVEFYPKSVNVPMIYQASSVMIHFQAAENFDKVNDRIYELQLQVSDEKYYEVLKYCMRNAAKPCAVSQLFSILTQRLGQMVGIEVKNWAENGSSAQICSELVYNILSILGYSIDKDVDLITPKDVYELVSRISE